MLTKLKEINIDNKFQDLIYPLFKNLDENFWCHKIGFIINFLDF